MVSPGAEFQGGGGGSGGVQNLCSTCGGHNAASTGAVSYCTCKNSTSSDGESQSGSGLGKASLRPALLVCACNSHDHFAGFFFITVMPLWPQVVVTVFDAPCTLYSFVHVTQLCVQALADLIEVSRHELADPPCITSHRADTLDVQVLVRTPHRSGRGHEEKGSVIVPRLFACTTLGAAWAAVDTALVNSLSSEIRGMRERSAAWELRVWIVSMASHFGLLEENLWRLESLTGEAPGELIVAWFPRKVAALGTCDGPSKRVCHDDSDSANGRGYSDPSGAGDSDGAGGGGGSGASAEAVSGGGGFDDHSAAGTGTDHGSREHAAPVVAMVLGYHHGTLILFEESLLKRFGLVQRSVVAHTTSDIVDVVRDRPAALIVSCVHSGTTHLRASPWSSSHSLTHPLNIVRSPHAATDRWTRCQTFFEPLTLSLQWEGSP
jgi:hypothetical protein